MWSNKPRYMWSNKPTLKTKNNCNQTIVLHGLKQNNPTIM